MRGTRITLENVTTQIVNYVKRDRTQYTALRTAFDGANGARAQFAKQIATNPTYVAALRRAGLDTPEKPGAGGFWQGLVAANQAWRDGGENINLLILGDNSIDFFAFDPATSDFGRYDRVTGESLARYDTADQMVEAALSPDA